MGAALFLEAVWLGWDKGLMLALFLSLMLILGTYVFTWPKYTASQAAETAFAVLYVPVLLSYVYRTDLLTESIVYTALTLLAAWCSDVGAYCMGMLEADEDADLLDRASWTKLREPVMASREKAGLYGPGHNSFTTDDEDGSSVCVFHARTGTETEGNPLYDGARHAYCLHVSFDETGRPVFAPDPV